jgi:flavin-dependent thymidylate synthase
MTCIEEIKWKVGQHKFIIELHSNPCATVEFIDGPMQPLQTIGKVTRGYSGIYTNDDITDEEVVMAIKDLNSTKLQTPFEMQYFVFLISNVSRAFTHQLVRTRVGASFVQQSMRFLGSKDVYRVLVGKEILDPSIPVRLEEYKKSVIDSIDAYEELLYAGVSSEEARGILPTNIMTSVFFGAALSTLQRMYAQRMCCEAQRGEWQVVMKKIKDLLTNQYGVVLLEAPFERGEDCGYHSRTDRPCIWKNKK